MCVLQAREYRLCKELKGLKGAVNALIFSKDRKLLLGGGMASDCSCSKRSSQYTVGDDGCVRVWNTEDFKCEQVLHSNQWGQVTTLSWVSEAQNDGGGASICIGTGRGVVSLCPMSERSSVCSFHSGQRPTDYHLPSSAVVPLEERCNVFDV